MNPVVMSMCRGYHQASGWAAGRDIRGEASGSAQGVVRSFDTWRRRATTVPRRVFAGEFIRSLTGRGDHRPVGLTVWPGRGSRVTFWELL